MAPFLVVFAVMAAAFASASGSGELTPDFYSETCPQALTTIKLVVGAAILKEPRMGASLVRMHFHDCFVKVDPNKPISNSISPLYCSIHSGEMGSIS